MKSQDPIGEICRFVLLLGIVLANLPPAVRAAEPSEMERLDKEAAQNYDSKEGQAYFKKFDEAISPAFAQALESCGKSSPDTEVPVDIIFVIAADGTVKRVLYTKDVPFGECVGSRLAEIKKLPPPPRDSWVVAIGAANHFHNPVKPNAPPDRPVHAEGDDLMALEKAIAPYVAKARATYPEAKKRFLAGLPKGSTFFVQLPLQQKDGKRETVFIRVESIKDGQISGIIDSDLGLVTEFKVGQRITFPEEKITNWLIQRPDGSEEGNVVGKFLDTYQRK